MDPWGPSKVAVWVTPSRTVAEVQSRAPSPGLDVTPQSPLPPTPHPQCRPSHTPALPQHYLGSLICFPDAQPKLLSQFLSELGHTLVLGRTAQADGPLGTPGSLDSSIYSTLTLNNGWW